MADRAEAQAGCSCRRLARRRSLTLRAAGPCLLQVTYLRGIFPDKHYKPVDMRNLDSERGRRAGSFVGAGGR